MKMKKYIFTVLLATSFLLIQQQQSVAQDRGFGIGAAVGGPDGISYKSWISETTAFTGLVSFSIADNTSSFYTHLDYHVHKFYDELDWEVGNLFYYYGGGVAFEWREQAVDNRLALRLPAGFGFNFTDVPVDLFFELAPVFDVTPDFRLGFNGNLGFRFYLN